MSPVHPDIEIVVGSYLRAHPSVTPLTTRVVSKHPTNRDTAWVRLQQLDGVGGYPDHLVDHMLQLDCYAGKTNDRGEASTLARTVRAVLAGMEGGIHSGAVVSAVRFTGHMPMPDDDAFDPARERVVLTCEVVAHPA